MSHVPYSLPVPPGCSTELNHLGYQFVQRLFEKHDQVSLASPEQPSTKGEVTEVT